MAAELFVVAALGLHGPVWSALRGVADGLADRHAVAVNNAREAPFVAKLEKTASRQ